MSSGYRGNYQQVGSADNGGYGPGGVSPADMRITEEELNSDNTQYQYGGSSIRGGGMYFDSAEENKRKIVRCLAVGAALFLFLSFLGHSNPVKSPAPTGAHHGGGGGTNPRPGPAPSNGGRHHGQATNNASQSAFSTMAALNAETKARNEAGEKTAMMNFEKAKLNDPSVSLSSAKLPGCESTIVIIPHCEKNVRRTASGQNNNNNYGMKHCNYVGFERAEHLARLFGVSGPTARKNATDTKQFRRRQRANDDDDDDDGDDDEFVDDDTYFSKQKANAGLTAKERGQVFAEALMVSGEVAEYEIASALASFARRPIYPHPSYVYAFNPEITRDNVPDYSGVETVNVLAHRYALPVSKKYDFTKTNALARDIQDKLVAGDLCGKTVLVAWDIRTIPHLTQALGCGPDDGCPVVLDDGDHDALLQIKYVLDPPLHPKYVKGLSKIPAEYQKDQEHKGWEVWGTLRRQNFDPLAFSAEYDDYDTAVGVVTTGGNWMIAEEKELDDDNKSNRRRS